MKKDIDFVVTDLDDTIWDWLKMWYNSFNPFLERISKELGIDINLLIEDFKQLHQKYGTTEASFLIQDLNSLNDEQRKQISQSVGGGKSIMHEYYSNKKNNLSLYDGVLETLKEIKTKGSLIVGFTESNSFFTKYRIKHLDLDGLFDCVYAPTDFELPSTFERFYADNHWEPEKTKFQYLPRKFKKPNKEILEIILKDFKATKDKSIYIGDKLDRDIYMAQQAEITSVFAEYGQKLDIKEYALLREVTHWTPQDVEREIDFKNNYHNNRKPDFELKHSYSELLEYFNFVNIKPT